MVNWREFSELVSKDSDDEMEQTKTSVLDLIRYINESDDDEEEEIEEENKEIIKEQVVAKEQLASPLEDTTNRILKSVIDWEDLPTSFPVNETTAESVKQPVQQQHLEKAQEEKKQQIRAEILKQQQKRLEESFLQLKDLKLETEKEKENFRLQEEKIFDSKSVERLQEFTKKELELEKRFKSEEKNWEHRIMELQKQLSFLEAEKQKEMQQWQTEKAELKLEMEIQEKKILYLEERNQKLTKEKQEHYKKRQELEINQEKLNQENSYLKAKVQRNEEILKELKAENLTLKNQLQSANWDIEARDLLIEEKLKEFKDFNNEQIESQRKEFEYLKQQLSRSYDHLASIKDSLDRTEAERDFYKQELEKSQDLLNRSLNQSPLQQSVREYSPLPTVPSVKNTPSPYRPSSPRNYSPTRQRYLSSPPKQFSPQYQNDYSFVTTPSMRLPNDHHFIRETQTLERQLNDLGLLKEKLESEYRRFPIAGGTLAMKKQKEKVELQLEEVEGRMHSIKMRLRQLQAL